MYGPSTMVYVPGTGAVSMNDVAPSTHDGPISALPPARRTDTRMIGTVTPESVSVNGPPAASVSARGTAAPPGVTDADASGGTLYAVSVIVTCEPPEGSIRIVYVPVCGSVRVSRNPPPDAT